MLDRLKSLLDRARPILNTGRSAASVINADEALKKEINVLSHFFLGRTVTGCSNCYVDALMELGALNSKRIKNAMERTENFIVRRGKIARDIIKRDTTKNLVRGNETDELALYLIYTRPEERREAFINEYFERVPDDLAEMLRQYGQRYEAEQAELAEADTILAKAEAEAKAKTEEIIADAQKKATEIVAKAKAKPKPKPKPKAQPIKADVKKALTS